MAATTLLAATLSVGAAFAAADTGRERFPPDSAPYPSGQKGQGQSQKGAQKKKKDQKSQQQLRDEYDRARTLILAGQYEAGIAAMRALDYDDNPEVAAVSTNLLEQLGYTVRRVDNAEAALREIEANGIDLVFSDIVMPGKMDGLSLARHLRNIRPGLPILLATGYSDAAVNVRGDFPILRKPYEIHQLSQAIAKLPR